MDELAWFRDLTGTRPASELDSPAVRELLGFERAEEPGEPRVESSWSADGVDGEEISWAVGYGPRTHGWLLRPGGEAGPLPGVLALHCHGGYKYHGKEKIADGPAGPGTALEGLYGGRAYPNELARKGFAVLVPDVLGWGSRRFDLPATDVGEYNRLAAAHEHVVAKYCTVLGTSMAALVSYEDRVAASYLVSRADVRAGPIGCLGLSGGGCRAALLQATDERIGAAVIAGMMSTHASMLDGYVARHTWMFFPPGLPLVGDWPDLAAARAPSPLLVQYLTDDSLFPLDGMRAAHDRLAERYGATGGYVGEFYPGPHRFDVPMQESAFSHLERWLG